MSFLNPVNEPVLRFSSTDAGAPQINYNARVAGDVKAVLKACLVTGYGAKASAGWSVVNEVNHVAEFVSPSAAMSDYRLGVDDSGATITTWYYQYQNARTNPRVNSPSKSFSYVDNVNTNNGWQLFITDRGFVLLELLWHSTLKKISTRMTFFGQVKSALINNLGQNMMFFNLGHNGTIEPTPDFYKLGYPALALASETRGIVYGANINALGGSPVQGVSSVDVVSPLYVANDLKNTLIAQIPAIMAFGASGTDSMFVVVEVVIEGRPALKFTAGHRSTTYVEASSAVFLLWLDYWEY